MATSKPAKIPEWNTSLTNQTEPNAAKKSLGWALNEAPPSSYFNWLQYFCGEWTRWWDERGLDGLYGGGGDAEDFLIQAPVVTDPGSGGTMAIAGGDAITTGNGGAAKVIGGAAAGVGTGGAVELTGGDADTAGNGGDLTLTAGAGAGAGGGGDAEITGGAGGTGGAGLATLKGGTGATTNPGGAASVVGGDGGPGGAAGGVAATQGGAATGTDTNGGTATLKSGTARGDGYGDAVIAAIDGGQGAGGALRNPTDYLRADGSAKALIASRRMAVTNLSGDSADALEVDDNAAAGAGALYAHSLNGHGVEAEAENAIKSALRVVPQTSPTSGAVGGVWVQSDRADQVSHQSVFGAERVCSAFANQSGTPDGNYTAEQVLTGGSVAFPANRIWVGAMFLLRIWLRLSHQAGGGPVVYRHRIRWGGLTGTLMYDLATVLGGGQSLPSTDRYTHMLEMFLRFHTIGAGGGAMVHTKDTAYLAGAATTFQPINATSQVMTDSGYTTLALPTNVGNSLVVTNEFTIANAAITSEILAMTAQRI